jgi:tetratricopeptide (TPR) repeat protein
MGGVLAARGDLAGALKADQEMLSILRRSADANPTNVTLQRNVAISLDNVGDILRRQGDLAGAAKAYAEVLADFRRLAAADPSNAADQRALSVSLNKTGDALAHAGDLAGAQKSYAESLAIIRRLAAADPSNVGLQRDIAVSLGKLAGIAGSGTTWLDLATQLEAMDARKMLAPADRPWMEAARKLASANTAAPH